jgi:hypothetical protein
MHTKSILKVGLFAVAFAMAGSCGNAADEGPGAGEATPEVECSTRNEMSLEIEEGSGWPTVEEAMAGVPPESVPPGEPIVTRAEAEEVEWTYVVDDEASGAVTFRLQDWGLWWPESVVQCP